MKSLAKVSLLLILLWPIFLKAQNSDLMRIEINAQLENEVFNLVPCDKTGFLLFYESVESFDENHTSWIFTLFGTGMNQLWTRNIPVLKEARFLKQISTERSTFLVFYNEGRSRGNDFNLQMLKFDHNGEEFISVYGGIEEKSDIVDVEACNGNLILGVKLKKYETALYKANFTNSKVIKITGSDNEKNLVEDIYFDHTQNKLYAIINHYISRKENYLLIKEMDLTGQLTDSIILKTEYPEIALNSGKIMALDKEHKIVLGTYNTRDGGASDLKNEDETISAGVFSVILNNNIPGNIRLYNFLEFDNFSSYIQAPGILKVKKKSEKDKEREYTLNYRLLLHDVFRAESRNVFFAEVYYPEYRTVSYVTYDYYGRPYPQSYTVFDGYKYVGGVVAGFDEQGVKKWDNGIKIWNIQSFSLRKKIVAFPDNDDLVLAYNSKGKIASEIFNDGQSVGDFEYLDLETKYSKDRITEDENSNMISWYDNYFLCYGYQEVKNNALKDSEKRTVFYINKVAFE